MESEPANSIQEIACAECGRFGAIEMGGKFLCPDCLSNSASSCAGSRDDDGC